jgi:hypothetical protein
MKKITFAVIGSVLLGTLFSRQALSVVPYPPSLEVGNDSIQNDVAGSTSPRSSSQVADKLAEDQKRLESVLQDLKEDQKALRQHQNKENTDGYSLR